ncbi:MAG TPA: tryptophan synthase subunit alpha [Methanospirillum sp.]|uniref:tryptophan synthase subunit alpha n=1 Tax=Methanospirillum sp. TaxID=45200 RepID=UPI002BB4DFF1|nr:tryptophan synthase subunit alpha [Methanospirillum sp.]HWQ64127.1 tryptophan synthase subunit alpha [Methanospirillum sp.]
MKTGKEQIEAVFTANKKPLLVAFTVAGDPDYETSLKIIKEMAASDADIIELGLPFSDPVADGPVIQCADIRAMDAGMNTDRLFDLVRDFRAENETPVVILTYANLLVRRGITRFYADAAAAGVNGVVIADVPFEESGPFTRAAEDSGIAPIMMVSPTTTDERLAGIVSKAAGFIYLVAVMGVTGARTGVEHSAVDLLNRVKAKTAVPIAPGFGISTPGQVQEWAKQGADAVIVGSAIVRRIEEHIGDPDAIVTAVGEYIRTLKQA